MYQLFFFIDKQSILNEVNEKQVDAHTCGFRVDTYFDGPVVP